MLLSTTVFVADENNDKTKINGSNIESFNQSLLAMLTELTEQQKQQLVIALLQLRLQDTQTASQADSIDLSAPPSEKILKQLDGKTYAEIVSFVNATSHLKVRTSSKRELPEEFAQQLEPTNIKPLVDLSGTSWRFTSNNSAGEDIKILTFLPDGNVKTHYFTETQRNKSSDWHLDDYWYQEGNNFRMTMNEEYAAYIGNITAERSMSGKFANVLDVRETWTAELISEADVKRLTEQE